MRILLIILAFLITIEANATDKRTLQDSIVKCRITLAEIGVRYNKFLWEFGGKLGERFPFLNELATKMDKAQVDAVRDQLRLNYNLFFKWNINNPSLINYKLSKGDWKAVMKSFLLPAMSLQGNLDVMASPSIQWTSLINQVSADPSVSPRTKLGIYSFLARIIGHKDQDEHFSRPLELLARKIEGIRSHMDLKTSLQNREPGIVTADELLEEIFWYRHLYR